MNRLPYIRNLKKNVFALQRDQLKMTETDLKSKIFSDNRNQNKRRMKAVGKKTPFNFILWLDYKMNWMRNETMDK